MKKEEKAQIKKAQTTVFIIIAIMIVIAIALTIYFTNQKKQASEEYFLQESIKPGLTAVQSGIIECAKETSKKALETIGLQGGYYKNLKKEPIKSAELETLFIPYYYYQGQYLMPPKEIIENQLSLYVDDNLENCINEIKQPDFNLLYRKPITLTKINEKNVAFTISQNIRIEKSGYTTTYELKDHKVIINSELDGILNLASFLTESHKQDSEMYCISCVHELADEDNLYIDTLTFGENEMLVIISENHTSSDPYLFEFLNKYTGEERSPLTEVESTAPKPPNKE